MTIFSDRLKELGPPNARPGSPPSLYAVESAQSLFDQVEGVDAAPTQAMRDAAAKVHAAADALHAAWPKIIDQEVAQLNSALTRASLPAINPNMRE